ncbi:MAG: SpoVG family protein [Gemmataceae bacterium]
MVITEVRIKLCEENNERLLAFCSVTFDNAFVVRDLKIIDGTRGVFVAMPSRKLTDRCGGCGCKNHLRARFCNGCGRRMDENRAMRASADGRAKLHADIAHPIHQGSREQVQASVVRAYQDEKERAKLPGYVCRYDDYDSDFEEADALTYGAVAVEMGKTLKAHGPHAPGSKGTHLTPGAVAKVKEEFGAGIV